MEDFNCGGIVAAARQEESQQSPLGKGSSRSVVSASGSRETLGNNEPERWSDASYRLAFPLPAQPRLALPRLAALVCQNSPGGQAPGRLRIINQKAATIVSGRRAVAGGRLAAGFVCLAGLTQRQ